MDGSLEQSMDRWMEIRCHSDEGGGAQKLSAAICPAEECEQHSKPGNVQVSHLPQRMSGELWHVYF